jgi:hypothetical protein
VIAVPVACRDVEATLDNPVLVFSGPAASRASVTQALSSAKLPLVVGGNHSWGLPSYADPIVAHAAGKPNSGHAVGGFHPAKLRGANGETIDHDCDNVGQPYEADPGVAFVAVYGDVDDEIRTRSALAPFSWSLRLYRHPSSSRPMGRPGDVRFDGVDVDTLCEELERRYAALRLR